MSTNEPGELFIISTPIGNLADITLRALEILRGVDFIVCEDTRVTLKLLNRYGIKKSLISFHARSHGSVVLKIVSLALGGSHIALVTDSGTPLISDPGGKLLAPLLKAGVNVVPVPGPSAVHAALAASGFSHSDYHFLGFLSSKTQRRRNRLEELKKQKTVLVFFESPYRVLQFLEDIARSMGNARVCVAKEMTKKFEKYYRGEIGQVLDAVRGDGARGEYTVVVDNR